MASKGKKTGKKVRDLPVKNLSARQAKSVRGGGKHIGGVKYEDITVNCATGISKLI